MEKTRRLGSPEQPRQLQLAAGRIEQIVPADDERHALLHVVDGHGKLVRPVAVTIADDDVAALLEWALLLRAVAEIDEAFDGWFESNAQTRARPPRKVPIAARAGIRSPEGLRDVFHRRPEGLRCTVGICSAGL